MRRSFHAQCPRLFVPKETSYLAKEGHRRKDRPCVGIVRIAIQCSAEKIVRFMETLLVVRIECIQRSQIKLVGTQVGCRLRPNAVHFGETKAWLDGSDHHSSHSVLKGKDVF
jgi:hypothetical protein